MAHLVPFRKKANIRFPADLISSSNNPSDLKKKVPKMDNYSEFSAADYFERGKTGQKCQILRL